MIDHDNYYHSGVDARSQMIDHDNCYHSGVEMRCEI